MSPIQLERINGLDTDALRRLTDVVEGDPDRGRARFSASTRWVDGARTQTTLSAWELGDQRHLRDFVIDTDEPCQLLGTNTAPCPQEYLLTALNSCLAATFVAACSAQGIELTGLKIESTGELDLRGFLGLDESVPPGAAVVDCTIRVCGTGTSEQFRAIEAWMRKTSPNYFQLAGSAKLFITLIIE